MAVAYHPAGNAGRASIAPMKLMGRSGRGAKILPLFN